MLPNQYNILCFLLVVIPTSVLSLVPHKFWNRPTITTTRIDNTNHNNNSPSSTGYGRTTHSLAMYFDDCERMMVDLGDWEQSMSSIEGNTADLLNTSSWGVSRSEEKRLAIDRLVGYNVKSASTLSDEKVEEETLRWAVDTNLVWTGEEEEEDDDDETGTRLLPDRKFRPATYECIKDLRVASSCTTILDSLSLLWDVLVDVLEQERAESQSSSSSDKSSAGNNNVHLIVFSKSEPLWNYDSMTKMLTAIQISKPFLPSELELKIDLFHPNYKHSPKMWSPEKHSPFPTVGLSISEKTFPSFEEIDVDAFRKKLNAIFQSVDATREPVRRKAGEDHQLVLEEAQQWFSSQLQTQKNIEWMVLTHDRPYQVYKTLWNAVLSMTGQGGLDNMSTMIVVPSLDSHTLQRVAVTVNAALKRLDIPVRITQVYRPRMDSSISSTTLTPSRSTPYGMIQLTSFEK